MPEKLKRQIPYSSAFLNVKFDRLCQYPEQFLLPYGDSHSQKYLFFRYFGLSNKHQQKFWTKIIKPHILLHAKFVQPPTVEISSRLDERKTLEGLPTRERFPNIYNSIWVWIPVKSGYTELFSRRGSQK